MRYIGISIRYFEDVRIENCSGGGWFMIVEMGSNFKWFRISFWIF